LHDEHPSGANQILAKTAVPGGLIPSYVPPAVGYARGFDYAGYMDDGPSFSDQAQDFNNAYEMEIVEIRRLLRICP